MEEFRGKSLEGDWWLPADPRHVFKGQLTIDERHHGQLLFRGTEEHLAKLPTGPVQPTFFGRLTNKYMYDVTLFDTSIRRGPGSTFPKKPENETNAEFYTNSILISGHIESQEDVFVDGAILNLTGLDVWCDTTGFSGRHENPTPAQLASGALAVTFQEQATPAYDVGNGRTVRLLSEYTGRRYFERSKHVTLKEKNTLEIMFAEPLSIKQVMQEIHVWQTLLTFSLRQPSYMDEITLLTEVERGFDRMALIVPGRKASNRDDKAKPETLFSQSKLGEKIGERLKAWREQHDLIDLAILIFSGAAYQDDVYTHTNLLSYLQALEVLHRELFKRDRFPDAKARKATIAALRGAIPTSLPAALQNELKESLGYIGSVTLLDRLKDLFLLYPKSVGPLFPGGEADMVLLKDVRNFLTHYGEQKMGKEFLWSRDIFVLKEKTRLFLEICLLGAMGVSDEDIEQMLRDFEPYNSWRMEVSMERVNLMLAQVSKAKAEQESRAGE
jgi:ApeA N-terminal domain 1